AVTAAQRQVKAVPEMNRAADEAGDLLVSRMQRGITELAELKRSQRTRRHRLDMLKDVALFLRVIGPEQPLELIVGRRRQAELLRDLVILGRLVLQQLVWREAERADEQRAELRRQVRAERLFELVVAGCGRERGEAEIPVQRGVVHAIVEVAELRHELRLRRPAIQRLQRIRIALDVAARVVANLLQ